MKARPTIRDVAKAAGVSLGTASRALNRTGRVSADAIANVGKAARTLGYEPDPIAQSMRTRSTGVIGVLVSDFANPLYARILTSIESELQRAGYTLLLASTHNDRKREKSLIDLFRRRRIDGLVLGPCENESPEFIERLSDEMPLVALDRDFSPASTGIQVDHYNGALHATRHLLNLGHQRIALMTPGRELRPGRERIAGFTDAYLERGLQPDPKLIRAEKSAMEFAFSEALSLLSGAMAPTAFLCLGTRILAGVLQSLRHSGRSVPDDASVISIGDVDLAQLFNPAITALAWDLEAMGRVIVQLMLKRLDSKIQPEPERIVITTQLILRDSCAPLTASARDNKKSTAVR